MAGSMLPRWDILNRAFQILGGLHMSKSKLPWARPFNWAYDKIADNRGVQGGLVVREKDPHGRGQGGDQCALVIALDGGD